MDDSRRSKSVYKSFCTSPFWGFSTKMVLAVFTIDSPKAVICSSVASCCWTTSMYSSSLFFVYNFLVVKSSLRYENKLI